MKAKIDASGDLFVDKGNGYQPQICTRGIKLQCGMLCPHFGEPKLVGGFWDKSKQFVRINICYEDKLEFESLYFEKTCIRLRAPLYPDIEPDNTPHSLSYWQAKLRELEKELMEEEEEEGGFTFDFGGIGKKIEMIKAYHLPD